MQTYLKNVTDQLTKLTRVQFKSNKNMEEKMDQFAKELSNYNQQNDLMSEHQRYERQRDFTMDTID
ncbi:hypothetical protein ABRT01_01895 [Lentibacillus sp. L22]|uniref:hypothetical protein n=1 Tax=Lentibacillus TaxID=175304 RepID=UPI0022B1780C|nr:hypothetical protein [Lentibacillus daqui]